MTREQEAKYREALSRTASSSWTTIWPFVNEAIRQGVDAETAYADARAAGCNRIPSDFYRSYRNAVIAERNADHSWKKGAYTPRRKATPEEDWESHVALLTKAQRNFVQGELLPRGEGLAYGYGHCIRTRLSEVEYHKQAAAQLRTLFGPTEFVWAGMISKSYGQRPFEGNGIIRAWDLAARLESDITMAIPPHVSSNPLTGTEGLTTGKTPSFDCLETVADFRHVIIEFDNLYDEDANGTKVPSLDQLCIVGGLIEYAAATRRMLAVCATYSGGKSVHTVLRVRARTQDEYKKQCQELADLFNSADDRRYRVDVSSWNTGANARTHVRLAGAIRPETGLRQVGLFTITR